MQCRRFGLVFWCAVFLSAITSCDLFDDGGKDQLPEDEYLVSYKLVSTFPDLLVRSIFTGLEATYPEAEGLSAKVTHSIFVYALEYKTTFRDQEVVASGLVCVPAGAGTYPLLSFHNGTNTLHSKAPSVSYNDTVFMLIESVASTGFIVALPDYLGFGASDDMYHPYLHKSSTLQVIPDMYRAIKEMIAKFDNLYLTKETYLIGYSQGGWATMAMAKEIEMNLADEFTLKANASGAGPYDLTEISRIILEKDEYPMPYFLAYISNSYIRSGEISNTYSDIFNSPYAEEISGLFDGNNSPETINSRLSTSTGVLFTQDFRSNYLTGSKYATLRTALSNNSVQAWKTACPTLIMHGQSDTFVPIEVSAHIYQGFQDLGVQSGLVTYTPLPGDHQDAVIPWGLISLKWILDIRD